MKVSSISFKNLAFFLVGFLWGITITYLIGGLLLKKFIILEYSSKFSVNETANKIANNAVATGEWLAKVSPCAIPQPNDGSEIFVITLCNSKIASQIVNDPESRKLSSIIPCQLAVYQKPDGSTAIAKLNFSLIGALCGETASEMSTLASEQQKEFIINLK